MGEAIARSDDEALEGMAGVERRRLDPCARLLMLFGSIGGSLIDDEDPVELRRGGTKRGFERSGVTPLDPRAACRRRRQVEGLAMSADRPQRVEPEAKGRGRKRRPEPLPNPSPDRFEVVLRRLWRHGGRS